mmetsp:Transcript_27714/g.88093  ORF Transcript_27714/g.88093 Transcript_27714/m.88093 type:complete len:293 (-) Transcript_27714:842-1720(-)
MRVDGVARPVGVVDVAAHRLACGQVQRLGAGKLHDPPELLRQGRRIRVQTHGDKNAEVEDPVLVGGKLDVVLVDELPRPARVDDRTIQEVRVELCEVLAVQGHVRGHVDLVVKEAVLTEASNVACQARLEVGKQGLGFRVWDVPEEELRNKPEAVVVRRPQVGAPRIPRPTPMPRQQARVHKCNPALRECRPAGFVRLRDDQPDPHSAAQTGHLGGPVCDIEDDAKGATPTSPQRPEEPRVGGRAGLNHLSTCGDDRGPEHVLGRHPLPSREACLPETTAKGEAPRGAHSGA